MRTLLAALAVMAIVTAGCTETLTEPGAQAIVGTWMAGSKVGATFGAGGTVTAEFTSGGDVTMDVNGTSMTGSYATSGSSTSSTIREITLNMSSPAATFTGIYRISGSSMELEVIPSPAPSNVVGPDAAVGIGSTTVSGATSTAYVTEFTKQ